MLSRYYRGDHNWTRMELFGDLRRIAQQWDDTQIDRVEEERYFIAPSLTFRPTADTSITLLGLYHRARFSADGVGPAAVLEARRCLGALAASWSRFTATDAGPTP